MPAGLSQRPKRAPTLTRVEASEAVSASQTRAGEKASERLEGRVDLKGRTLRTHTARGTIVNAVFLIGLSSLGVLKGFLVAVFLTTTEYGTWGILLIALSTLLLLKQAAVSDKFIQQSDDDQELAFQKAFTLELMLTAVFLALMLLMAPLIAIVYGRPELLAPGVVVALVLCASVFMAPTWVFYRRMDFVKQRTLQAIDPLLSFVVTIGLVALTDLGYWSLVIGAATGACVAALVAVVFSPYPLALRYDRGTMRDYLGFSGPLLIAAVSTLLVAQGTLLIGESAVGLAGVGAITLAVTVSFYADRVDLIVTSTLYPALCAVRDRTDLLFESFVKSNRLGLMWAVPFGIGLALFADDLVTFGLGEEWRPAVVLLQVFGVNAAINHLGFNWHAFYRARGETKPVAVVTVVMLVTFFAVAAPLLIHHGLEGFAAGMAVTVAVPLVVRFYFIARLFPGFPLLRHAARAIAPTVPAACAVLLARSIESAPRTLWVSLIELSLFLAITFAAALLLERDLLREVKGYLENRGGPRQADVVSAS